MRSSINSMKRNLFLEFVNAKSWIETEDEINHCEILEWSLISQSCNWTISILPSSREFRNRWKTGSTLCDGSPSFSQMFASRESGGSRSGFHFACTVIQNTSWITRKRLTILYQDKFYRSDKISLEYFSPIINASFAFSLLKFSLVKIFSLGNRAKVDGEMDQKIDFLDRFHPPCNFWFNRSEGWQGNDTCAPR